MDLIDLPADSDRWIAAAPVLQELRTERTTEELREIARLGAEQGLAFLGAFDGDDCLGVAGWRIMVNTHTGRKLYVDDLVTTEHRRSAGVGRALLAELSVRARAAGCTTLELDSGVQRFRAHRFYLREGFDIASHHFTLPL